MRSGFAFHYQHRVRLSGCDPQWVVFNGHYLTFFDVAITQYMRTVGLPSVMTQQRSGAQFFASLAYLGRSRLRFVIEVYKEQSR